MSKRTRRLKRCALQQGCGSLLPAERCFPVREALDLQSIKYGILPIMVMANEPPKLDDEARRLPFRFVGQDLRSQTEEVWREGFDVWLLLSKLSAQRALLRRGLMVGLGAGLAIATLWLTLLRAPAWTASTEIFVANTTLQLSGQDAVVTQLLVENTLLQSQMLLARSHAVMERAIDRVGAAEIKSLLPRPGTLSATLAWLRGPGTQPAGGERSAREALVLALKDSVAVSRSGASQIVVMRVRGADADAAVRLASEVTQAFIAESRAINAVVTTSGAFRERIQVLGPTVRLISEAVRPKGSDGPRALLVLLLGPLSGAIAGLGIAVLLAAASRRIWSAGQLVRRIGGEFLGYVPESARPVHGLASGRAGDLPAAMRSIRAAALEKRRNRPRIIGVTSAGSERGRTTVASGFALLLASSGQRVLLVDAAFDSAALTRSVGLEKEPGLRDVLRDPAALQQATREGLQPDLDVLGTGLGACDVDALWPRLPAALTHVPGRAYDWVILDLPPIEPPSAIRAAGAVIDDLILVVGRGAVVGSDLEDSMAALGLTRAKLLGVLMSIAPPSRRTLDLSALASRLAAFRRAPKVVAPGKVR